MKTIGERLRAARERAGVSQQEAAEQIGITRASLSNWENGRHLPTLIQFRDLLTMYAASPYEILYGARKYKLTREERAELAAMAVKASPGLKIKISLAMTLFAEDDESDTAPVRSDP